MMKVSSLHLFEKGNDLSRPVNFVLFPSQLTFEGIIGWSYAGDIAIDDVAVSEGNCPGKNVWEQ